MALHLPPAAEPLLTHIKTLASPNNPDLETLSIKALASFARLKAINRESHAAVRAHKQATADARLSMDQTHLDMQNLMYEKRHLENEIEKCTQFASIFQDIPLHSIEEFTVSAPGESRTDAILGDEHQLMLGRLSFELLERQRLHALKLSLIEKRDHLLQASKDLQKGSDAFAAQMDVVVKTMAETARKMMELLPFANAEIDPPTTASTRAVLTPTTSLQNLKSPSASDVLQNGTA